MHRHVTTWSVTMQESTAQGLVRAAALTCALATGCYSGVGKGGPGQDGDGDAGEAADDDAPGTADDDGGDDGDEPGACAAEIHGRTLQRLDPVQYRNTMRDLFGDPEFEPTYDDEADVTTERGVRQFRSDAEAVVARRESWTATVYPCATDGSPDDACVEQFITDFGRRAMRRPIDDDTRAWLRAAYDAAIAEGLSFEDAMDVLLATMLQAPELVYLIEVGVPVEGQPANIRRLDDHELASRLSYFLWDTMPDEALFAAADAGELSSNDGVRVQIERMLADPRSETKLQHFVSTWLQLDGGQLHNPLEESAKDPELFPEYTPALQAAMREEIEAFVHRVFYERDAAFEEFFTSREAYVNKSLADLYGVPGPADDDTWEWVELPAEQRAGLLTRAGFLTVFAAAKPQSPIRRGVFVIEELMCTELGEPPPNASDMPVDGGDMDDPDGQRTVREEVTIRTADASCATCHGVINPVGFTLEHYDAIGRWQDIELVSGLPIDSSGMLTGEPVKDGLELSQKLAMSGEVRACFADRWLSTALGVAGDELDDCTREEVTTRFTESGDVRELVVAIAQSDAFRFLNTAEGE
jgi:hypothetical protein